MPSASESDDRERELGKAGRFGALKDRLDQRSRRATVHFSIVRRVIKDFIKDEFMLFNVARQIHFDPFCIA